MRFHRILVITDHRQPAIRSAGFLYLLDRASGAIAILCARVLHGARGDLHVRARPPASAAWASVASCSPLRLRRKAGMLPLHAWLPEAHAGAPSPFALYSGII